MQDKRLASKSTATQEVGSISGRRRPPCFLANNFFLPFWSRMCFPVVRFLSFLILPFFDLHSSFLFPPFSFMLFILSLSCTLKKPCALQLPRSKSYNHYHSINRFVFHSYCLLATEGNHKLFGKVKTRTLL